MSETAAGQRPVVIKKYANRRLYNTATSAYVTLEHLAELVKRGVDFVVRDAKTDEDITRSVLAQIIFEQESRGETLLPAEFLRQLIGFYGESMQAVLPSYLQMSLSSFAQQQDRFRHAMSEAAAGRPIQQVFQEQAQANMALFDQAMKMFAPPFAYGPGGRPANGASDEAPPSAGGDPTAAQLDLMRQQMAAMQAQLDRLSPAKSKP